MPTTFKDFMVELAPPWLRASRGEAWHRGLGDVKDSLARRLKDGVKARLVDHAPGDALDAIGGERGMPRSFWGETDAAYRARLKDAWGLWAYAGTAFGMLRALYDVGYTTARLVSGNGRDYRLVGGTTTAHLTVTTNTSQSLMLNPPHWTTFFVFLPMPYRAEWSGTAPANGSAEARYVLDIVKRWRPGHAHFSQVIVEVTGMQLWGYPFGGAWADPGLVWGATPAVRWYP